MSPSTGQILHDRYRIVRLLGQGGFGAVYRAWDTTLDRPVALKENLETSLEAQRQFMREAKLLANLSHPNLPRVTDYFILPERGQYLVMDFVEGEDLQEIQQRAGNSLPEATVLPWITQVCDALAYLHSQNPPVIHRDIKPANIRVTKDGKAMLVDFGIAKVYDPQQSTTVGARAVTPGFSPHEQYGQGTTDARSDVYALGATLYFLLTGRQPTESIQRMVRDPLPPVEQLNRNLSTSTVQAVQRAMQIDPELRFQSATEFKLALQSISPTQGMPVIVAQTRPPAMASPAVAATPATAQRRFVLWGVLGTGSLLIACMVVAVIVWRMYAAANPFPATPTVLSEAIAPVVSLVALDQSSPGPVNPPATTVAPVSTPTTAPSPSPTLEPPPVSPPPVPVRVLKIDGSTISSISFSPDNLTLASGSYDRLVRLWNAQDGNLIDILQGHTNGIRVVSFSPDGLWLASGSVDNTIRLWDTRSKALVHTLKGQSGGVWSVSFSPDSRKLASGSGDGKVRLWDVQSGVQLRVMEGHSDEVTIVAFSPDGDLLASGSKDGKVLLWQIRSGLEMQSLRSDPSTVWGLAFSADGQYLAYGSEDGAVRIRNVTDGALVQTLNGHSDTITTVVYSWDGTLLASGDHSGSIRIWQASDGALLASLDGHTAVVSGLSFSPDDHTLASGAYDGTIRLWWLDYFLPK